MIAVLYFVMCVFDDCCHDEGKDEQRYLLQGKKTCKLSITITKALKSKKMLTLEVLDRVHI